MKKRGRKRPSALSIIKTQKVKHKEPPFDLNRIPVELWDYMIDIWGFYISRTFKEAYYKNINFNRVFGAKFDFVVERDQLKKIHLKYDLIQRRTVKFLWIDGVILNVKQMDLIVKLFTNTFEIHVNLDNCVQAFLKSHDIPSKITHINTNEISYLKIPDIFPISLRYLNITKEIDFNALYKLLKMYPYIKIIKSAILEDISKTALFCQGTGPHTDIILVNYGLDFTMAFNRFGYQLVLKDKYKSECLFHVANRNTKCLYYAKLKLLKLAPNNR